VKSTLKKWLKQVTKPLTIWLELDPAHPMVILRNSLDWNHLIDIAERHRRKKLKSNAGKKPSQRILIGAVIVRVMESCTLRKASDLMRHYGPARYLCGLEYSIWTPNFRTLSDFEILLGIEGLREINNYVLQIAKELGFIDIKGLCADTTAQEAMIPYPNEVGLMGSFAKSVDLAIDCLKRRASGVKDAIKENIGKIKKLVRKHRLFCKSKEEKQKTEKSLLNQASALNKKIKDFIGNVSKSTLAGLCGHQKIAFARLKQLSSAFTQLAPDIDYYICNRSAANGKIVSLFLSAVHAIVRGKIGKKTEFGIKWVINQIRGGYISIFKCGKASEQDCAVKAVEHHKELFGVMPVEYGYDRGGWSEPHIKKIKEKGVKRIAIAPKGKAKWKVSKRCQERMTRERAQVEGKIGTMKQQGFNRPHAKTNEGMERSAHRSALRFNLTKLIKDSAGK